MLRAKVQGHDVRGDAAKHQEQFTSLKHDTNLHHVDKPCCTCNLIVINYDSFYS